VFGISTITNLSGETLVDNKKISLGLVKKGCFDTPYSSSGGQSSFTVTLPSTLNYTPLVAIKPRGDYYISCDGFSSNSGNVSAVDFTSNGSPSGIKFYYKMYKYVTPSDLASFGLVVYDGNSNIQFSAGNEPPIIIGRYTAVHPKPANNYSVTVSVNNAENYFVIPIEKYVINETPDYFRRFYNICMKKVNSTTINIIKTPYYTGSAPEDYTGMSALEMTHDPMQILELK
jgi:hypothetical protein